MIKRPDRTVRSNIFGTELQSRGTGRYGPVFLHSLQKRLRSGPDWTVASLVGSMKVPCKNLYHPPIFSGMCYCWIFKPYPKCGLAVNLLSIRIVSIMCNKLMRKLAGPLPAGRQRVRESAGRLAGSRLTDGVARWDRTSQCHHS